MNESIAEGVSPGLTIFGNYFQVLHIINEVLEPVVSKNIASPLYNPDAFQFLNQSDNIDLGHFSLRNFRNRIFQNNKHHIFQAAGRYTFFIPVDRVGPVGIFLFFFFKAGILFILSCIVNGSQAHSGFASFTVFPFFFCSLKRNC